MQEQQALAGQLKAAEAAHRQAEFARARAEAIATARWAGGTPCPTMRWDCRREDGCSGEACANIDAALPPPKLPHLPATAEARR